MIKFFRRLFIKDYQNVQNENVRGAHGKLAAWFGIISNLLLVAMKLGVAFAIGAAAYNASASANRTFLSFLPVALVADAINNLSDMASSVVTLLGFKFAAKPADKKHPFGHQRIEYIAGLAVSCIVIVLAVELFRSSLENVIAGTLVEYDVVTVVILGVSVLLKLLQAYFNYGMGKAIASPALKATSLDSFTDSISTFLIMISGILCLSLGWNFLDGYMGIVVSFFVIYSGIKMLKDTANPLIGEAADYDYVEKIIADIMRHKKILGVHDVICHSYGPTKMFISLHAEVDQRTPILEAHGLIDDVEEEVRKKFAVEITIHMDPIAVGDPLVDKLKAEVRDELASISKDLQFHDFRIVKGPTHTNMIFDIVLPYGEDIKPAAIYAYLGHRFADKDTKYHFVIHFDTPFVEQKKD
ncbi:MAG: cation diffusion facilitator family transporter [Bacilli bacterium]|jgi:cation diffusion facilitator family transporter|nr:cation diffusion facilitator family transporter [Bacilli bacterium]